MTTVDDYIRIVDYAMSSVDDYIRIVDYVMSSVDEYIRIVDNAMMNVGNEDRNEATIFIKVKSIYFI